MSIFPARTKKGISQGEGLAHNATAIPINSGTYSFIYPVISLAFEGVVLWLSLRVDDIHLLSEHHCLKGEY